MIKLLYLKKIGISLYFESKSKRFIMIFIIIFFITLLLLKVIIGISLIFFAGYSHNKDLDIKKRSSGNLLKLANIERFSVYKGRVLC